MSKKSQANKAEAKKAEGETKTPAEIAAAEAAAAANPTPAKEAGKEKAGKKEPMVKLLNKTQTTYDHGDHGKFEPGQLGEFPESYAKKLIKLGNGLIQDEDMAKAEFKNTNKKSEAPLAGSEANTPALSGYDAFTKA